MSSCLFEPKNTSIIEWLARSLYIVFSPILYRQVRKDVLDEIARLRVAMHKKGHPTAQFKLDFSVSSPGLGDTFVVVVLMRYLSDLGFLPIIMITNYSISQLKFLRAAIANEFPTNKVILRFADDPQPEEIDVDFFAEGQRSSQDLTPFVFPLLKAIYEDSVLNPDHLKPNLEKNRNVGDSLRGRPVIGIGVRHSANLPFRNPSDEITLKDLTYLAKQFPNAEVRWFGEIEHFSKFVQSYSDSLVKLRIDLNFQSARSYLEAIRETTTMDVWFQRWGGGIDLGVIFSDVPYVRVSNDVAGGVISRFTLTHGPAWRSSNQYFYFESFYSQLFVACRIRQVRKLLKVSF